MVALNEVEMSMETEKMKASTPIRRKAKMFEDLARAKEEKLTSPLRSVRKVWVEGGKG